MPVSDSFEAAGKWPPWYGRTFVVWVYCTRSFYLPQMQAIANRPPAILHAAGFSGNTIPQNENWKANTTELQSVMKEANICRMTRWYIQGAGAILQTDGAEIQCLRWRSQWRTEDTEIKKSNGSKTRQNKMREEMNGDTKGAKTKTMVLQSKSSLKASTTFLALHPAFNLSCSVLWTFNIVQYTLSQITNTTASHLALARKATDAECGAMQKSEPRSDSAPHPIDTGEPERLPRTV